ncbi:MAG: hypothetical protein ACRCT6_12190, partial [Notoacmeibacter sp.]
KRTTPDDWQRILAFRNCSNFKAALPRYHELMTHFYSGNLMLNKVVTEAWRFEMLVYALHLYDSRDPANPRSGLTLTNLEKICVAQKCASPGRVRAIIGIMWLGGFIKRYRSKLDSRIVHFEPSQDFIAIVEGWNNRIFQIIDAVYPEGKLAECHALHQRFGWEMRKGGAQGLLDGWKLLDPFPEVFHFVSRDGGWMLLLHCAFEALRLGNGTHIAPVSVDLAEFGVRFGVSRSHLRRLLEAAYKSGLLSAPPQNGSHIVLAPELLASYLTCMASELDFFQGHSLAAKVNLGLEPLAI